MIANFKEIEANYEDFLIKEEKPRKGDFCSNWSLANSLMKEKSPISSLDNISDTKEVNRGYRKFKRIIDIFGATSLLIGFSPLIILTAILVKLTSRGAVIFKQERLTLGNKTFTMYKFRSMQVNAEANSGATWASVKDVRTTPIGRFIRLTRLDELPQLINVLDGSMSLIGPRPERPEIAEELKKELPGFERRLEVKAGLSGLAQVSSGYASCIESYRKKLAYDIFYVDNLSFGLDLRIALRTVIVMLTGSGAR